MARTLLDYVPVRKKNIVSFLNSSSHELSSIRVFDLIKKIPDENEKLNAFVKYYDKISHNIFENSYLDLFSYDNKFNLLTSLEDKIFDESISRKLNEILEYFNDETSKLKVIDSLSNRLSKIDDIDTRLIMETINIDSIKLKILDIVQISSNNKYLYYCNYVNVSNLEKINNIDKYGKIDLISINIENYISKFLIDEIKSNIIKKYYEITNDNVIINNLSKCIRDENIRNQLIYLANSNQ